MVSFVCNSCMRISPTKPRCPACQQARDKILNARSNQKAQAQGRTTAHWKRLRIQVLVRDEYTCQRCGSHSNLSAHPDPRLGGNHFIATRDDCTTLCRSCHGTVDAPRARRRL